MRSDRRLPTADLTADRLTTADRRHLVLIVDQVLVNPSRPRV
jgi:hypothetical protein